jgi:hypothetical protein
MKNSMNLRYAFRREVILNMMLRADQFNNCFLSSHLSLEDIFSLSQCEKIIKLFYKIRKLRDIDDLTSDMYQFVKFRQPRS